MPMTMESDPVNGSVRITENPASLSHSVHSAPVKSNPPGVSSSMLRLIMSPKAFFDLSSSMMDSYTMNAPPAGMASNAF